jgi:hypothetical protein
MIVPKQNEFGNENGSRNAEQTGLRLTGRALNVVLGEISNFIIEIEHKRRAIVFSLGRGNALKRKQRNAMFCAMNVMKMKRVSSYIARLFTELNIAVITWLPMS